MVLIHLLDPGLPKTFNLLLKKKKLKNPNNQKALSCPRSTIKCNIPVCGFSHIGHFLNIFFFPPCFALMYCVLIRAIHILCTSGHDIWADSNLYFPCLLIAWLSYTTRDLNQIEKHAVRRPSGVPAVHTSDQFLKIF